MIKSNIINSNSLHFLLMACHAKFRRLYMHELEKRCPELHLLPGQPKIIEFLMHHESAYQRQIADGCLLEPSTLSLILAKMEKSGLIERYKKNNNRKNSVVALTAEGRRIGEIVVSVFSEIEEQIQEHCSTPEKSTTLVALRKISEKEDILLMSNERKDF